MGTGNNINPNLISIIVPVYNGQEYIDRCVISILEQTYSDWELLLIDGASGDNSPQLCDLWQAKDDRIRVFHENENRGVSAGRNRGLRNAKGSYITFVDADDWLRPDCLQRLHDDIQQTDVEIAGCAFVRCNDKDWEEQNTGEYKAAEECKRADAGKRIMTQAADKRLIEGKDFLNEGILKQDTRCWSKLYKRELLEGHFFREDYTIGEDMLFVWEVSREARLISSSDYAGYCYYHNPNGAMLKRFRETDIDQVRCWQFLLEQLQDDTNVISKTASILLISCMLTAGKLAALPANERKQYREISKKCRAVIKETLCIDGAYEKLDRGYRIKVQLYKRFPNLYMMLYHLHG